MTRPGRATPGRATPRPRQEAAERFETLATTTLLIDSLLVDVELIQELDTPEAIGLQVGGRGFEFSGSIPTRNAVWFDVLNSAAVRELGEALIALADRAELLGILPNPPIERTSPAKSIRRLTPG